jgi:hypothetical protein
MFFAIDAIGLRLFLDDCRQLLQLLLFFCTVHAWGASFCYYDLCLSVDISYDLLFLDQVIVEYTQEVFRLGSEIAYHK